MQCNYCIFEEKSGWISSLTISFSFGRNSIGQILFEVKWNKSKYICFGSVHIILFYSFHLYIYLCIGFFIVVVIEWKWKRNRLLFIITINTVRSWSLVCICVVVFRSLQSKKTERKKEKRVKHTLVHTSFFALHSRCFSALCVYMAMCIWSDLRMRMHISVKSKVYHRKRRKQNTASATTITQHTKAEH